MGPFMAAWHWGVLSSHAGAWDGEMEAAFRVRIRGPTPYFACQQELKEACLIEGLSSGVAF